MRISDVKVRSAHAALAGVLLSLATTACSSSDAGDMNLPSGGGSALPGSAGNEAAGAAATLGGSSGAGGSTGTSGAGSSFGGAALGGGAGSALGGGTSAGSSGAAGASGGGGGSVAPNLVYPPAAGAGDVADAIEQLNLYRTALGLSAVALDEASSAGCEGHLRYLIEEAQTRGQRGYLEHTEMNHDNSHYSPQNEQAGKDSDLAWGQSGGPGGAKGQSLGQAVDLWINGVYHRRPLLEPGLKKVGAASIDGYNCFNYNAAGNTVPMKIDRPVLWPADGMTDVPRAFGGNEGPCPTHPSDPLASGSCGASGFIISATYYNWGTNRASAITAIGGVTLTNAATQANVPLLAWYADGVADHDPARGYMRDEIALVPEAALAASTSYRVDIDAVVSGSPAQLSWTFTTGTRSQ